MDEDRYYCLSMLPALGELGSAPPLSLDLLLDMLTPCPTARRVAEVVVLHDDLRQREGFLAGELTSTRPAVLTPAQVRNESPLPAYLTSSPVRKFSTDSTWEAYFRHAAGIARACACGFVADWVSFEVGLRNALAIARARQLGLEAKDYLVAPDLGEPVESFASIVTERAAAATPLAELQILIKARWVWLRENEAWFSFRDDEFAAYAAKLMLLIRYERLAKASEPGSSSRQTGEGSRQMEEVNR